MHERQARSTISQRPLTLNCYQNDGCIDGHSELKASLLRQNFELITAPFLAMMGFLIAVIAVAIILSSSIALHASENNPIQSSQPQVQDQALIHTDKTIAIRGDAYYQYPFMQLRYANRHAKQGGTLKIGVVGSFDSVHPFISIGNKAAGLHYVTDQLMVRVWDRPFEMHAWVAESISYDDNYRWASFKINPKARFHNNDPITVEDVIFSFRTLKKEGRVHHQNYFEHITVTKLNDQEVKFHFHENPSRELMMIVAGLPILHKKTWEKRDFSKATIKDFVASGPYKIIKIVPGREIIYQRVKPYWASDLPSFVGHHNFDKIHFKYYNAQVVAFEAFKAGEFDFHRESNANKWYHLKANKPDDVFLASIKHRRPSGLKGFAFNVRKKTFQSRELRMALSLLFDHKRVNDDLFHGVMHVNTTLFDNSDLASYAFPDIDELGILSAFDKMIPKDVFTEIIVPTIDRYPNIRARKHKSLALLEKAGYRPEKGKMVHQKTKKQLSFEIMVKNDEEEALAYAFSKELERFGIKAIVHKFEAASYIERKRQFDYDMVLHHWRVTASPGEEQKIYWGSEEAKRPGSRNYAGVQNDAIDRVIDVMSTSKDPKIYEAACRALNRLIYWDCYVVPLFYKSEDWMAYHGHLDYVRHFTPMYGTVLETWWHK